MIRFGLQHSSDDVVLYKTISSEMPGLEFQRARERRSADVVRTRTTEKYPEDERG